MVIDLARRTGEEGVRHLRDLVVVSSWAGKLRHGGGGRSEKERDAEGGGRGRAGYNRKERSSSVAALLTPTLRVQSLSVLVLFPPRRHNA